MKLVLVLLALVVSLEASSSFLRLKKEPKKALARLLATQAQLKAQKARGVIGCQACVDFFDADLQTILNIILQVGVEGTCQDICSKLPSTVEGAICEILCMVEGLKEFINVLSNDDLDPIYICAELHSCVKNNCTGPCTTIAAAQFVPAAAKLRTKFEAHISIRANQNTGVGVTAITWPCTAPACQSNQNQLEVVNDGFTQGSSVNIKFAIDTAEDEWMFPIGTSPVTIFSCGSDCVNEHGTVFSNGYSNFTITN